MKSTFRKIISLLTIISLMFVVTLPTLAVGTTQSTNEAIYSDSFQKALYDIPFFVTKMQAQQSTEYNEIKVSSEDYLDSLLQERNNSDVAEAFLSEKDNVNTSNQENSRQLNFTTENFSIVEMSANEKEALLNNPIFTPSLQRAYEIYNSELNLDYVNILMKSDVGNATVTAAGGLDSAEYWESNYEYLGTYNSYKFLYSETAYSVSTNNVKPGNVTASFNWGTFLSKTLASAASLITDSSTTTVQIASAIISNIVGSTTTPLSVTYGAASDSSLLTRVQGHIYTRSVFLEDKLDKFSGYAYYYYGSCEQIRLYQFIDAMVPISKRTSTTYNYKGVSGTSSLITHKTPGFDGGSSFYSEILSRYRYTNVYSIYTEAFDPSSIVMSVLS